MLSTTFLTRKASRILSRLRSVLTQASLEWLSPDPASSSHQTTIYLIRHAQSAHNIDLDTAPSLRHAGPLGSDLTPRGVQEAHSLARRLRYLHTRAIYSSSLLRATHTAAILAASYHLPVVSTDLLREHDLGLLHRQTDTKRILRAYARIDRLQRGRSDQEKLRVRLTPGMETEEEAALRMTDFLRAVARQHPGKTILVVSHFAIMRAFLVQLGFAPYDALQHGSVPNGAYFRLSAIAGRFVVEETHRVHLTARSHQPHLMSSSQIIPRDQLHSEQGLSLLAHVRLS